MKFKTTFSLFAALSLGAMPGVSQTIGICGSGKISATNDLSVTSFDVTSAKIPNLSLTSATGFSSQGPLGSVSGAQEIACGGIFCAGVGTTTIVGSINLTGSATN